MPDAHMKPHCVYRIFSECGDLLYIGCSRAPMGRIAAHYSSRVWGDDIAVATFQWFPNYDDAFSAETAAIISERPKWNVDGNPDAVTREVGRYMSKFNRDDPSTWTVASRRKARRNTKRAA